jgi:hypothetical protein
LEESQRAARYYVENPAQLAADAKCVAVWAIGLLVVSI